MLEVVIGEEIKLVEEILDIDTTQGIHLRKWQNAREPVLSVSRTFVTCNGQKLT